MLKNLLPQNWDIEMQGDSLLNHALANQVEQLALFEVAPVESQYNAMFMTQVEAKHEQVERIEDSLESLIAMQSSRLQQVQASKPGMLSLPSTRAKWQQQLQHQQGVIQRLQGRMETVREIKDGMSIHGSRIEELATRKLRAQEPELAKEWDEMKETQRLHEALQRKKEQEKKLVREREKRELQGRGNRLGLSLER